MNFVIVFWFRLKMHPLEPRNRRDWASLKIVFKLTQSADKRWQKTGGTDAARFAKASNEATIFIGQLGSRVELGSNFKADDRS